MEPVDVHRKNQIVSRYASRTMIYSGLIIAAFAFYTSPTSWKVPQINGVEADFEEFYVHEEDAGENQVAFETPLPEGKGEEGKTRWTSPDGENRFRRLVGVRFLCRSGRAALCSPEPRLECDVPVAWLRRSPPKN